MSSFVVRARPRREDPHEVVYFRRHSQDDAARSIPAKDFIASCPVGVRAKLAAVLASVAAAPPYRFSGGGFWEAMRAEMGGWFEVRVDGPKPNGGKGRHHYRLYCLLDTEAKDVDTPLLVVVTGLDKPFRTAVAAGDYGNVRALGEEYLGRNPRSLA